MASLIVVAYRYAAYDSNNRVLAAPQEPNLGVQEVDIGPTPVNSDELPDGTSYVCVVAEDNCTVSFGKADPVPVWAGERLYFGTSAGIKLTVRGM